MLVPAFSYIDLFDRKHPWTVVAFRDACCVVVIECFAPLTGEKEGSVAV